MFDSNSVDWELIERKFLQSIREGKGIFIELKGEYAPYGTRVPVHDTMVYWATDGQEETDLFDYRNCIMFGTFDVEMRTGEDALISFDWLEDEDRQLVIETILDETKWQPIKFVELQHTKNSHSENELMIIKEGELLPKNATGRFLVPKLNGAFEYE